MKLVLSVLLSLAAVSAFAEDVVDKRQENQEQRIEQGEANGSLTNHEAKQLENQQKLIERREDRMKADGKFTKGEKRRLNREQNRASRNINRKKHNLRGR